jgi:trigger factor
VTDDEVNALLERLRHQQATWEPMERPVEFDDLVVLDIESDIEGEPFINQKGVQYQVRRDSSAPAPGFAEQLLGLKKGEDKEFSLRFPSDYHRSELAEKEVRFKVGVGEIKQERLPELTDELAKQVSPDFETLDSLRERLSTELKQQAEEKAKRDFEEKVIQEVVDLAEVEFPPILVDVETDRMINEQARRLQMGGHGLEDYLSSINKTEPELREELKPLATKRVTSSLVLGKVAEEEKIDVSDSELDAEIGKMLERVADNSKDQIRQSLNTLQSRESVKQLLFSRKTIERLAEIARGQDEK